MYIVSVILEILPYTYIFVTWSLYDFFSGARSKRVYIPSTLSLMFKLASKL